MKSGKSLHILWKEVFIWKDQLLVLMYQMAVAISDALLIEINPFGKVHKIKHDVDGFQYLLDCMERLNEKTNEESCVVYEATGVYTKPLIRFLNKHEVKHYMVNPLQAAKMRKTDLHSKKTDKNDPNSIAKVYYDKDLYEYEDKEQIYHNLQVMNRNYEDQLDHLRKYKVTFQIY